MHPVPCTHPCNAHPLPCMHPVPCTHPCNAQPLPCMPPCHAHTPHCGQNSWHTLLKILPCPNFVAGGNNSNCYIVAKIQEALGDLSVNRLCSKDIAYTTDSDRTFYRFSPVSCKFYNVAIYRTLTLFPLPVCGTSILLVQRTERKHLLTSLQSRFWFAEMFHFLKPEVEKRCLFVYNCNFLRNAYWSIFNGNCFVCSLWIA